MKSNEIKIKFKNFEWIDVTKPTLQELNDLSKTIGLEASLINDSLQHGHLPKIEKLEGYTFLILRAYVAKEKDRVATVGELSNKIAFFIKDNHLVTIHRTPFPFLENLKGEYAHVQELLLDIIKEMVYTFEQPGKVQSEVIDEIEQKIFLKAGKSISLEQLYYLKSKARVSKKLLIFTHNALNHLDINSEFSTKIQDIRDSINDSILVYEEVSEDANNLLNSYLSITAQKSNDVMKLLTVFSAFFLPLTFVVGVYGMNFKYMPELEWKHGYYYALCAMATISAGIFFWFKHKKII